MILDLESATGNGRSLFEALRDFSPLRHTPLAALIEGDRAGGRRAAYDAGADLVLAWCDLEAYTGGIPGLALNGCLNGRDKPDAALPAD